MKRMLLLLTAAIVLGFSGSSWASLYDRGNGMIYDDVLNITWLQDGNYAKTSGYDADGRMTWDNAVAWAANLVYGGYDDWRLPTAVDGPYIWGNNGSTTAGYNITSSEMGYMFYVNLGNKGMYNTSGVPQDGYGLQKVSFTDGTTGETRSFQNLQSYYYWTGTVWSEKTTSAWESNFNTGSQDTYAKGFTQYAWAVCDGDVAAPVPIPGAVLLLGGGLIRLGAYLRRRTS